MALNRLKKAAEAVPEYPGREQAEKVARMIVESVGGPLVRHATTSIVLRTLGYWVMWSALKEAGYQNPRAEMIDRRWIGRTWAFEVEADFRHVYGCRVGEFRPEMVVTALGIAPPEDEGDPEGPSAAEAGGGAAPAAPRRPRSAG